MTISVEIDSMKKIKPWYALDSLWVEWGRRDLGCYFTQINAGRPLSGGVWVASQCSKGKLYRQLEREHSKQREHQPVQQSWVRLPGAAEHGSKPCANQSEVELPSSRLWTEKASWADYQRKVQTLGTIWNHQRNTATPKPVGVRTGTEVRLMGRITGDTGFCWGGKRKPKEVKLELKENSNCLIICRSKVQTLMLNDVCK